MADSVDAVIFRLQSAQKLVNIALDDGASQKVMRSAVRTMAKALEKFVDNSEIRTGLLHLAIGRQTGKVAPIEAENLLENVADLMTEQHAALLVMVGYLPPPPAWEIVEATHNAVRDPSSGMGKLTQKNIESLYSALRKFIAQLWELLSPVKRIIPRDLKARLQRMTAATMLLAIVSATDLKTGEEFNVDVNLSLPNAVKIEVTIPVHLEDLASRMLAHITFISLGREAVVQFAASQYSEAPSQTVELGHVGRAEQSVTDDLSSLEDPGSAPAVSRVPKAKVAPHQWGEPRRANEQDETPDVINDETVSGVPSARVDTHDSQAEVDDDLGAYPNLGSV